MYKIINQNKFMAIIDLHSKSNYSYDVEKEGYIYVLSLVELKLHEQTNRRDHLKFQKFYII
jgi:hypothetical protein